MLLEIMNLNTDILTSVRLISKLLVSMRVLLFSVSWFQFIISELVKDHLLAFSLGFQHVITQHRRCNTSNDLDYFV